MATLTVVTNKSTVLAVQQIQALIAELNEAIKDSPHEEIIRGYFDKCFNPNEDEVELTIQGYITVFHELSFNTYIGIKAQRIALKLRNLFKLFEE